MKRATLILPLAMIVLASCGGGSSSQTSTPGSTSTSTTSTSTSTSTGGTSTSTTPVVPLVASIADVRTAAIAVNSGVATTNAYEVTGTVTALIGRSYHIQSGEDAIYVYHGDSVEAFPTGFEVGKKVKVTAYATNYNGMPQLALKNKYDIKEEVLGDGDTISPLTIESLDLSKQEYSSRMVRIEGLTYISGSHTLNQSSRNKIIFQKGGINIYCYVDKTIADTTEEEIRSKLSGFTPNSTTITFEGNLGYNSTNDGLNIMPSTAANLITA